MQHINKIICLLSIITFGLGNTNGCMDNGYQQWSPNDGSQACNYAQFARIEGECLYNNCLGECPEIFNNDGNDVSVFG